SPDSTGTVADDAAAGGAPASETGIWAEAAGQPRSTSPIRAPSALPAGMSVIVSAAPFQKRTTSCGSSSTTPSATWPRTRSPRTPERRREQGREQHHGDQHAETD